MTEDSDELEQAMAPHNVVDPVVFGRRLRALRIISGYDRVADFAREIRRKGGVEISDRTIYAVERGEQPPTLDFYFAALYVLRPDEGPLYFMAALRGDVAAALSPFYAKGS
jgi:transcriptional regulator with XRE-family HTH domain